MEKTACPSSYVVVDLETTGLYPSQDRILEIGAVKVLDGEVTDTFCMFADPQMKIPERIRELTGITQEMVEGQPTPAEAVRAFLDFCGEQDLTNLCGYVQIDRAHAHRAYHDALATHELYQHLIRIAGEGQERIFQPKQLQYKVKRRGPITPAQKAYLNDLVKYHKIELDVSVDSLTKNEASRKIDTIIARYGRIKR